MAYDFSPWLDQIRRDPTQGGQLAGAGSYSQNGMFATPIYGMGQQSGMDGYTPGGVNEYRVYKDIGAQDAAGYNGQAYDRFDANGNYIGSDKWSGLEGDNFLSKYGPFLMLAAGMAPAMMGAGGATGATGGAGGFVGEGAASGVGAWDGALAGASPGSAAAGVGGAGGFIGEGAASGIPAWDAAGAAAGAGGAGAAAGGAGSLLSGLGGKALGLGATALGALAGSQGTGEQTQEKRMDPRLDQYVYGDLLPQAKGLLAQQMPLAQQYGNQMMQVGTGLLGAGIAPNGFERFTRGRY